MGGSVGMDGVLQSSCCLETGWALVCWWERGSDCVCITVVCVGLSVLVWAFCLFVWGFFLLYKKWIVFTLTLKFFLVFALSILFPHLAVEKWVTEWELSYLLGSPPPHWVSLDNALWSCAFTDRNQSSSQSTPDRYCTNVILLHPVVALFVSSLLSSF